MQKGLAKWISYPADFEIQQMNKLNLRRRDRELIVTPVWHMYQEDRCVAFLRHFFLEKEETIHIYADGVFNVEVDRPGNFLHGDLSSIKLKKGKHALYVTVYNPDGLPCLFVEGEGIYTDSSWECHAIDGNVIKASDSGNFTSPNYSPNSYRLPTKDENYVSKKDYKDGVVYDFGRETFGFLAIKGLTGKGTVHVYYGESSTEAKDIKCCENIDDFVVKGDRKEMIASVAKALRYVYVVKEGDVDYEDVYLKYEYAERDRVSFFTCNDKLLNRIFDVSMRTMDLTTREFFIDGIKRDRWVWMGDAMQSIMMNWYSFSDLETAKRTLVAMAGKGRFVQHMNTINDYTLFWFIATLDYYNHTGDRKFLEFIYPRAEEIMRFIFSRLSPDGMMRKQKLDWVFVDWADGLTEDIKKGAVCYIQILLWKSYKAMEEMNGVLGNNERAEFFGNKAERLKELVNANFWDEQRGIFRWGEKGKYFRQPNVMAIVCDFASEEQIASIRKALVGKRLPEITTPYMRFYEMVALARCGANDHLLDEMKAYWGGMLKLGATSFWEKYDQEEKGAEHYAMYNRKYGKSLCHAWGATPLYLIGRYVVGLRYTFVPKKEFVVSPAYLGKFDFEATYYMNENKIRVIVKDGYLSVMSTNMDGKIVLPSGEYSVARGVVKRVKIV